MEDAYNPGGWFSQVLDCELPVRFSAGVTLSAYSAHPTGSLAEIASCQVEDWACGEPVSKQVSIVNDKGSRGRELTVLPEQHKETCASMFLYFGARDM